MADTHAATPNRDVTGTVSPESQNATSTVPSRIAVESIAEDQNDSEATKIVSSSPGV
jgi:hypothetical protein